MKVTIYVRRDIHVSDDMIPELAERARQQLRRWRRSASHIPRAVDFDNIVNQAIRERLVPGVDPESDEWSNDGEECRVFYRGELMNNGRAAEMYFTDKRKRKAREGKRR